MGTQTIQYTEQIKDNARKRSDALKAIYESAMANAQKAGTAVPTTLKPVTAPTADTVTQSTSEQVQQGTSNTTQANQSQTLSAQTASSQSWKENAPDVDEQVAEQDKKWLANNDQFVLDENGNPVRNPNDTLYNALQVDRDKLRGDRARRERALRWQRLENAIAKSAMLLSDMGTATAGGNVWKRDKDTISEDATKEINDLRAQQIADDLAAKEKDKQELEDWKKRRWENAEHFRESIMRNMQESQNEGTQETASLGNQITNTKSHQLSNGTQAQDVSDDYMNRKAYYHSLGLGGGNKTDYLSVKVHTANGEETYRLPMPAAKKEAIANELANVLSRYPDAEEKFKEYFEEEVKGRKKVKKVNLDRLINDGVYLKDPYIMNTFLTELEKQGIKDNDGNSVSRAQLYEMITGKNIFNNDGTINPKAVMRGITLNGVAGVEGIDWFGN